MKKVIALALTLAMVLALGVTAFAAGTPAPADVDLSNVPTEMELGKTYLIQVSGLEGADKVVVSDTNGFIKFTDAEEVSNLAGTYVTKATAETKGVTEVVVSYEDSEGEDQKKATAKVTIAEAEEDIDADLDFAEADAFDMIGSKAVIYLDGKAGISAELYNAVALLHPERIVITDDDFCVILYRGDYTTATLKKNVKIHVNVEVADRLYDAKGNDMNNRVLAALGNNKADPFYVTVDTERLTEVASKPELTVNLSSDEFTAWAKTNDVKAMNLYTFDDSDDTIALVEKNVSINNNFEEWLEMPAFASATYVLVDADNGATSSANTKPNASTGANDMVAVAVVFATIALAAGVAKKVR